MTELIKEEELRKSGLSAEELLVKFKEQITKDFEMANVMEFLPVFTDMSYQSIKHGLTESLERMSKHNAGNLQNLLYRIDISEKQFSKGLEENKEFPQLEAIAILIIKRILQKVILKVIYSK